MKAHRPCSIAVLFISLVLSIDAYAAGTSNPRFSARVKVTVTASDNIKSNIVSYLNRELRSLNDVELVDTKPDWEICVLALELSNVGGYKTGVALATVYLKHFENEGIGEWFKPQNKKNALNITSSLYWRPDYWLVAGSTDDVQKLCKDIIAYFDSSNLEEDRKIFRLLNDTYDKSK